PYSSLPCTLSCFFFFRLPRPPTSTLFPYTTLFRSVVLPDVDPGASRAVDPHAGAAGLDHADDVEAPDRELPLDAEAQLDIIGMTDRKSTRLNSSHVSISYAVFCLKKKKKKNYMRIA